ncbi:MAG: Na+/H+ antiporter NhaA [Burkholderiales bacterium]|nr:Na+/H+ antiporter NhaA [Burkholderiales bacterium]
MLLNIRDFLKLESAGGIVLVAAAALALIFSNSPLSGLYEALLAIPLEVRAGDLGIAKPLLLWVNDGLMAIFFFLVGLEIKREVLQGELSTPSAVALPIIAALGGMAAPAAIYACFNWGDAVAINGWAIPAATDIAFALGVLSLLGSRVPISLKIFLTAVAIIDDLGAILIIAFFYAANLSAEMLMLAAIPAVILILLNRFSVIRVSAYAVVGFVLWVCVLKSGVHATLAGVLIAFAIPLRGENAPLEELEHRLHPWVAFGVLPIFAFFNTGVSFSGLSAAALLEPIPLGIAAGLIVGKPFGILTSSWLTIKCRIAKLPDEANWIQMAAVALLCGIGFTMSLFIGSLALEGAPGDYAGATRLGVFAGSLISALAGYAVFRLASQPRQ